MYKSHQYIYENSIQRNILSNSWKLAGNSSAKKEWSGEMNENKWIRKKEKNQNVIQRKRQSKIAVERIVKRD